MKKRKYYSLNKRNTVKASASLDSPIKNIKTSDADKKELKHQNEGIQTLCGPLDFVPYYTVVEWSGSDLRDRLTIVIELPSGKRLDGIVYGVVDEGSTF